MTRTQHIDAAYKKYMADASGLYTHWELYLKASGYADAVMEHNGKIDAGSHTDQPTVTAKKPNRNGCWNCRYKINENNDVPEHCNTCYDNYSHWTPETPTKQPETVIESETRRGCVTCANTATMSHLEPCISCIRGAISGMVYPNWTPKPVDK